MIKYLEYKNTNGEDRVEASLELKDSTIRAQGKTRAEALAKLQEMIGQ